ncbi:LuxR C-terminal-related transcriptional regulator [Paenibacillus sp. sptzw28]|uniref:helix-turn-helix transcriptional regulator n=1 Tax=Paenibacillus sp. sptzw28 TaxID=715179 RepID=UPI001C6E4986|nr:helix-turn-helix transcriptional regulator [Paenibacillus sp. sptzw28]QYR23478.1 LuxR C-terminal-related transcriptional regulator [Paenibacillus sp. sptzw28]
MEESLNLFTSTVIRSKYWSTIDDMKLAARFDKQLSKSKLHEPVRAESFEQSTFSLEEQFSISLVKKEISLIQIVKPHLFIYTNVRGVALLMNGFMEIVQVLEQHHIGIGTSFTLEHLGQNAVSLAMHTGKLSIVSGSEHTNEVFKTCSCICAPIHVDEREIGYLVLLFSRDEEVTFCIPLIEQIVRNIEKALSRRTPDQIRESIFKQFEQYQLTYREMQVAYEWFCNKCVPEIAMMMGISELTVRTHIKKIYKKTKVCHKGEFTIKLITS